jgi:hypothetical protein
MFCVEAEFVGWSLGTKSEALGEEVESASGSPVGNESGGDVRGAMMWLEALRHFEVGRWCLQHPRHTGGGAPSSAGCPSRSK